MDNLPGQTQLLAEIQARTVSSEADSWGSVLFVVSYQSCPRCYLSSSVAHVPRFPVISGRVKRRLPRIDRRHCLDPSLRGKCQCNSRTIASCLKYLIVFVPRPDPSNKRDDLPFARLQLLLSLPVMASHVMPNDKKEESYNPDVKQAHDTSACSESAGTDIAAGESDEVFQIRADGVDFRTVSWQRATIVFTKIEFAMSILAIPEAMAVLGAVGGSLSVIAWTSLNTCMFSTLWKTWKRASYSRSK